MLLRFGIQKSRRIRRPLTFPDADMLEMGLILVRAICPDSPFLPAKFSIWGTLIAVLSAAAAMNVTDRQTAHARIPTRQRAAGFTGQLAA